MSHAAFLSAIASSPDDDTARLVYADFLDEQGNTGDAARAEFIRVQMRLAGLDDTHPDRPALEDRENELLRAHEHGWVGPISAQLARGLRRWRFERGFLDTVQISTRTLSASGAALFKAHPVSKVRLTELDSAPGRSLETLAGRPWWSRVRDLDTGHANVTFPKLERLLRSPHLTSLRKLALTANGDAPPVPRLPEVLAGGAFLPSLEEFHLRDWRHDPGELVTVLDASSLRTFKLAPSAWTADGLRALLTSDFARRGGRLHMEHGNLGAHLWPAFRAKKARPAVTRMVFGSSSRNPQLDLPTLLSAPAAANLAELDLSETRIDETAVREVAKSGFVARAIELGLTRCEVGPKTMAALAKVEAPNLRKLTLGETGLGNAGVFALCEARWADSLTELDLMRNGLDDDALVAMANSGRFVNVRRMDLRVNSPDLGDGCRVEIGDKGVSALATAPNFARLRHLNVYRTRVTTRGIDALLNGGQFRLTELELGGYDLGAELPSVLATSPGLARLTKLSMSFTPTLGGDALMPLAESPYLSPLCQLDIKYNNVGSRVIQKLRERLGHRLED